MVFDLAQERKNPGVSVFMKRRIKQMLPVLCVMVITIMISILLYHKVIRREEDRCWQFLSDSAHSVEEEIAMKFEDEIVKLHLLANMVVQEDGLKADRMNPLYFETFQATTIFSRVDLIYPDNTVWLENGTQTMLPENVCFEDLAAKGEYMTERVTDTETGKECVCYSIPVESDGEIAAILVGVIEANSFTEIFQPKIYDGMVNCCIVDSADGNFIMDSWHEELGNAYETMDRKRLKEYEDVDLKEEVRNHRTGVIAFVSNTNGRDMYMYYTPIRVFDWQLMIFTQGDVIFENLFYLKKLLTYAGIVEFCLLALYFSWNVVKVSQLEKSKEEIEKQQEQLKFMSYRDMLTSLYNRNKYMQMLDSYRGQILEKVGIVYIDLNGLKQVNDSKSHGEGDKLIRNAAESIARFFTDKSYRIGGDEFVVLDIGTEKDEFLSRIEEFHQIIEEQQISVSAGFLWKETCDNLEAALKEAEQRMYKEKESYYQTHNRHSGSAMKNN